MQASTTPRKTCDKCYIRKIKCDRQRPRCSHCITYATECTYAAPSRPSRPRPRKQPTTTSNTETTPAMENLHTFVEQLQAQVVELTQRLENTINGQKVRTLQQPQPQLQSPVMSIVMPSMTSTLTPSPPSPFVPVAIGTSDGINNPALGIGSATMTLPPFHQVMPLIRIFLDTFNAVMPLFHPKTLLRLVNDWFAVPNLREPVPWAAINVVLALTYKQNLAGSSVISGGEDLAAYHLSKAQSVISTVIFGNTSLLNVQVLVAMTMLLQASKDLKPSLVIISAAMRLAHDLGLHTRALVSRLDPNVAREHSHVFWIAYILDKDLSMRARRPSIQRDDDINIDMPASLVSHIRPLNHGDQGNDDLTNETLGVITTLSGDASVNYFLARVRLANIQGGIYDYLYSARSQTRSRSERVLALESLVHALEEWKATIPPEFSAALAPNTLSPVALSFFCVLHATNFACMTMINQANAWNEQWVQSLRNSCNQSAPLRLPSRWEPLVHDARDFVVLFETIPQRGYSLIWETACSYLTAATLLAANIASRPFEEEVPADMRLITTAVKFIDDLTTRGHIVGNEHLQAVRNACVELNRSALRKREGASLMSLGNFTIF